MEACESTGAQQRMRFIAQIVIYCHAAAVLLGLRVAQASGKVLIVGRGDGHRAQDFARNSRCRQEELRAGVRGRPSTFFFSVFWSFEVVRSSKKASEFEHDFVPSSPIAFVFLT